MTQTEKYKLNLLDGGDRLSTKPLNENMEKVEQEFKNAAAALSAAVGFGGHNARIAFGSYVGGGSNGASNTKTITVDFTPVFVQVVPGSGSGRRYFPSAFVRGALTASGDISDMHASPMGLTWGANSVAWTGGTSAEEHLNASGKTYYWVAIGYTEPETNGEA
jgi:hypothetical protein